MTDKRLMTDIEIGKRVIWLENEIDTCLAYDLPTTSLENDLIDILKILETRSAN